LIVHEALPRARTDVLPSLWRANYSHAERIKAVALCSQFEPGQGWRTSQDQHCARRLFGERQAVTERIVDQTILETPDADAPREMTPPGFSKDATPPQRA